MLDRDGTLIYERHYLADPDQVELLPGVVDGLRLLRNMGLGLVVLTNQSGLARGLFDLATLEKIHARMEQLLMDEGLELDGIYYCPHLPEQGCSCRKPAVGMVERATKALNFNSAESFMVGDKDIDIRLGKNVGAKTILVLTGYGQCERSHGLTHPDHIISTLVDLPPIVAGYLAGFSQAERVNAAASGSDGAQDRDT